MRFVMGLLAISACVVFGGVAFGVNPIGPMPESYIGYRIGPVVPYLSLGFYNASGHDYYYYEYHEEYDGEEIYFYENADTAIWSGSILMPTLGTKVVLGAGDLKPFIRLSGGVPFLLSLKVEVEEDDQERVDDIIEDLKENSRALMIAGGAGVEYYLTERFSIGGEFIYRYISGSTAWDEYDEYEDELYREWERWDYDEVANIGMTSAGLWLNFYF